MSVRLNIQQRPAVPNLIKSGVSLAVDQDNISKRYLMFFTALNLTPTVEVSGLLRNAWLIMVCYFEHYVGNPPHWFMYPLTFNSEADNNDERASSPTRRTVNDEAGLPIAHLQRVDREAGNPPSQRSQLFSAFASMAFELVLSLAETPASSNIPDRLRNKDLGSVNIHLVLLGYGSTFLVSTITQGEGLHGLDTIVLKRSIPLFKDQSESQVKKRIHSLMNELRVLAHGPIRKHENIVRLLGIAWETDPFDELRRWPVLLMEKATRGTLADFLQQGESYPPNVTLTLCLDVVLGLEILHTCGILHGDLKLENVLVLENSDPNTRASRPYIAKLADFGGILFDLKLPTVLPSGTRPWNAPEWQDVLEPQSLLKTDLYSLGFLLWRIVTNGKHPFFDFGFPQDAVLTVAAWDKVESLKREDSLLAYMKSISNVPNNINIRTLHNILEWTVRLNSNFRSLDKVKSFVHDELDQQRAPPDFGGQGRHQYQLRDQSLPFSFVGVNSLDSAITKHVAAELIQTAQDTARPQEASEASYGLAVLIMNGLVADERSHKGREGGLLWLEEAAHLGNDRAKAVFFRACKAFGSDIPAKSINRIQPWLLDAGSKGYFTALEDLRELGLEDSISEATTLLGAIYGGTGAKRFDDDLFRPGFPFAGSSFDEDLSKRASTVIQVKNFRINHFADCILHFAASCGLNETAIKLVANDPAGVDTRNINGETPLLLSCRSGHYHISMVLLEAGADPKLASHYGDTPLHWLSSFEDKHVMDVARKLIERGAELDAVAETFQHTDCRENEFVAGSPLMRAVGRKRLKVIEALLELGADPNVSVEGTSAISLAAGLHHPHILELLLSESRHEPRTVDQSSGLSFLFPAIRGGCIEPTGSFFGRVQRHGSRWRYAARETIDVLICHGAGEHLHDVPGLPGLTALGLAVCYAEPDLVEHLLEIGCAEDINRPSTVVADPEVEHSPLTESICSGKLDTFHLLVKKGANVKALHYLHRTIPVTLLYECAWNGIDNANVAQNLIDLGVPVDERPADYETPFGCALRNRCFELARCLLRNGADINAEYNAGLFFTCDHAMSTLGHLIAECSISSVVCLNFILSRPKLLPRFVVSQDSGRSVLHALAITPHRKQDDRASALILDCLLTKFDPDQSQLDLTITDQKYSALHLAALHSNYPVARGLLFAKANPSLKDAKGFTALDTARYCLSNFPHSFEFLVSAVPRVKTLAAAKKRVERMVTLFEGNEIEKGAQAVRGD